MSLVCHKHFGVNSFSKIILRWNGANEVPDPQKQFLRHNFVDCLLLPGAGKQHHDLKFVLRPLLEQRYFSRRFVSSGCSVVSAQSCSMLYNLMYVHICANVDNKWEIDAWKFYKMNKKTYKVNFLYHIYFKLFLDDSFLLCYLITLSYLIYLFLSSYYRKAFF